MRAKSLTIIIFLVFSHFAMAQFGIIFKNNFEYELIHLNDTGITFGADYPSGNNASCSSNMTSSQDCFQGRDATDNDDVDGHAGFSFTKLDASGIALVDQSVDYATSPWACVRDNVTGLVWEIKTTDGGIHDKDDSYNWYNTNASLNGGRVGFANDDGAICFGYNSADDSTFCNTQAYTARVNSQGLCGDYDWRMPDINELYSIVNHDGTDPAIDSSYFPNNNSNNFWTATPDADNLFQSWILDFNQGTDNTLHRTNNEHVRLVRDGQ